MENCVFCKIIGGKIPARIISETDDLIVFLDLKNHPLIVTKKHIENIYGMDFDLGSKVIEQAIMLSSACKKGLRADGISIFQNNEPAAGQEVMHYHMHIKPRWSRDSVHIDMPQETISESKKDEIVSKIKEVLAQSRRG